MNFFGERVVLRGIERKDLTLLAAFHNDPEVGKMIEFSWPISLEQQERFFERQVGDDRTKRLVIETTQEGVIGYTGLWGIDWIDRRATNGIIIGKKEARRKGYAVDALETIAGVAFDHLGLHRLDADIFEFNEPSRRLYIDRCGWTEEGRRREHIYRNGRWWDRILVGLTEAEWRSRQA
jgi:RimJ/RimL family protein N-acetyltransferase